MSDEHEKIHSDFDDAENFAKGAWLCILTGFLVIIGLWCATASGATTVTRQGGTADFACCEDADCKVVVGPQFARDWAAKDACAALTEADGKVRYFRQWPMRVEKVGTVPPPPPPAPTEPILTLALVPNTTNPGNSNVTLTWTAVTGATGYVIERCTGAGCSNFAQLATATVLAYANTNLPPGVNVSYRVRDAGSLAPYSNVQSVLTPSAPALGMIFINAGGPAVDAYVADTAFVGGSTSSACNRTMAGVYRTRRYSGSAFEYRLPLANGTYVVRLLWQECWYSAVGGRVLSASVEGQAIPAFDTWSTGGAEIMHERAVTVTDGVLNIAFAAVKGDAMVNAIEVSQTGTDPLPPPPPATGSATLSWTPPTTNTDGSTLTNLAGFRISYGTSASSLTRTIDVANAGVSKYVVEQLSAGPWYFAVRAYTSSGAESANSNIATRVVL